MPIDVTPVPQALRDEAYNHGQPFAKWVEMCGAWPED